MPETDNMVDILIGKVDAAHVADFSVNHTDFAVVAVVQVGVQRRDEAVKTHRTHATFPQHTVVVAGQLAHGTRVIVEQPHIDPLPAAFADRISRTESHISPGSMMKYSIKINFFALGSSSSRDWKNPPPAGNIPRWYWSRRAFL